MRNFKNTFCYRTPPVATYVCCRRKVAAVKIEKLKGITKQCESSSTQLHPPPPSSTQLHPPPPSSIQLHPPPPSSFQPPPSSIHVHPAHFSLHPALCNNLNNFPKFRLRILKFQPQNLFLGKLGPKKSKLPVLS